MTILINNIIKIINSYNSGKNICICIYSKSSMLLLGILIEKKIIKNFFIILFKNKKKILVIINSIIFVKIFSTPSCKKYIKSNYLKKISFNNGLIISSSFGLITIKECLKLKIGGKLLFSIV
ncbi:30S ribosomal protein S8 [Candidatus Carsonella ruddii]|uniref:Small ribosomal subunit protein uS8 n=1 Tax=Candidatus Carsonella ruddii PC isolate NHV TaxID=1202540 RepID=J3VR24_CARRU|nr:30S ribosomal protein S8 [Candidatus Carsonella ruddii]AFP84371.1 putative ribosomal protein S8 [Candidatus Carsonella ruddii PC isolate NHV]